MALRLTEEEIQQRLIRLRNLERLYPEMKQSYAKKLSHLTRENDRQKAEIETLIHTVQTQQALIHKLQLRIEELELMVFGRKKKKKSGDSNEDTPDHFSRSKDARPRPPDSYRRPTPKEEEVSDTEEFPIERCPDCNTPLQKLKKIIRYIEDIILPSTILNPFKRVHKQIIETGYCPHCQRRVSSVPVPKNETILGDTIKQFTAYSNIILRLSFKQTKHLLRDLARISISDGEIANILEEQSYLLTPAFQELQKTIRGQPGSHYDETPWNVQREEQGHYAWVMTGTESADALFLFGRSRGKGNARELQGKDNSHQVGITDDYGAYRTLFARHQLCWSHPLRKLRDLARSSYLDPSLTPHCTFLYTSFARLFQKLQRELQEDFDLAKRKRAKSTLLREFDAITSFHSLDIPKLHTIKHSLRKNRDLYFTCLTTPGIPPTNNKAERALRHIVLKRKSSFGSRTQKGASITSILASVLLSLWWKKPQNFFQEYSLLLHRG